MLDLSKTYTIKEIEELPYEIYFKFGERYVTAVTDSIKDIDKSKFITGIINNLFLSYDNHTLRDKRPIYINVNSIQTIELTDKAAKAEIAIKEFLSK